MLLRENFICVVLTKQWLVYRYCTDIRILENKMTKCMLLVILCSLWRIPPGLCKLVGGESVLKIFRQFLYCIEL